MKLKNILLCASVLGGLALSSCTGNFLDEDRNPNSLDPENFWKSESDILKGLTAAYAGLQPTIEWAQPFERYIVIDNYRSGRCRPKEQLSDEFIHAVAKNMDMSNRNRQRLTELKDEVKSGISEDRQQLRSMWDELTQYMDRFL